jgi:serine phosphatase RsbU (regulator of sigma subunit)
MYKEILVQHQDGTTRTVSLLGKRLTLGRSSDNDLSYPDDSAMSRRHLILERDEDDWILEDLGSKNGTQFNGQKFTGRKVLRAGDKISVGRVLIIYDPAPVGDETMVFVEDDATTAGGISTASVHTSLQEVVAAPEGGIAAVLTANALTGSPRIQALLDAGRQLANHSSLSELFPTILQLSIDAVGAQRGILMTLEGTELHVRAARGDGFRISRAVRDQVITKKQSLLVIDTAVDEMLKSSATIVAQEIKSLMAVPLQTAEKVTGLIYVDSPRIVRPFTPEDLTLLTVMSNIAAIRIEHARLMEVEQVERMMSKELEQAAEIQRNLLPKDPPIVEGFQLAGYSVACRSVGGDYFDYLRLPKGKMGVIVGDVAGKGLPAALMMSSLQARVQVLSEETEDIADFVTRLNRSVSASCPGNRFITFFIAMFDPANGEFSYCNAGHNPPFLIRKNGDVEQLEIGGPVLGILKQMQYQSGSGKLEPGDIIGMYSDGVTEARNPADDEFGDDPTMVQFVERRGNSAQEIVTGLFHHLEGFMSTAPAADDITLVVLKRT